jgi:replicative DNA helicase
MALEHPALTMCLAVQPDVLRELGRNAKYRGRGLLGRFLYAWPESRIGWRDVNAPPVPALVVAQYHDAIMGLLRLPVQRSRVGLDNAAQDLLREFITRLEVRMRQGGDLAHLHDWAGKLAGAVVRISGVCHAVECQQQGSPPWDVEITAVTVARAIRLSEEFLIPHAQTTFGEMGADPELVKASQVLRVVLAWDGENVSRSELHQRLRGGGQFRKPADLDRPLALLEEYGWLRAMPDPERTGPGRSRSPRYEINPLGRAENPENPTNWQVARNSQDIQDIQEQDNAAHCWPDAAPGRQVVVL